MSSDNNFRVDLNSDLGESFGNYKISGDAEIIKLVSSANIACGCHAGDPVVMNETVMRVKESSASGGAHPGYPDMQGFGRRSMALTTKEVSAYVTYQVGALMAFFNKHGVKMQHVKPHGALYNTAGKDIEIARAVVEGVRAVDPDLILMGLAGSKLIEAGRDAGMRVAQEVFADRAYEEDGSLRARTFDDAVIHDEDEAVARTVRMIKEGKIRAVSGKDISIQADSVCVHGDGAKALEFVRKIRAEFEKQGIEICPIDKFVK